MGTSIVVNDFRKVHKNLYSMKQNVVDILEVPTLNFVSTSGNGARNVYDMHDGDVMWSLSRVTNRIKDMTKINMNYKFKLMPLEVIWSATEENIDGHYSWMAMMQLPDIVNEDLFASALRGLEERNRSVKVPLTFGKIQQGLCAQALHIGPYNEVESTINRIKHFCDENGYHVVGDRREIYINAPFCNSPEKLQTIVRIKIEKTK